MSRDELVLDASALVELLMAGRHAAWVDEQVRGRDLRAPAHMLAETLSALGRVHREGHATAQQVEALLRDMMSFPVVVDPVGPLLAGAWSRKNTHALPDALYVELAARLGTVVITTDQRLARVTPLAVAPPGGSSTSP